MPAPRFELHVRPMFRAIDREHMKGRFDLWSYDDVVHHCDAIISRIAVSADMPTQSSGGPWPAGWIEVLRQWKDGGFKRLELGSGVYSRSQQGLKTLIVATGTFPAAGCRGWFELESETTAARNYALFFDRPDQPAPGAAAQFTIKERYDAADTRQVFIRDANGVTELHSAPAPAFASLGHLSDADFFS